MIGEVFKGNVKDVVAELKAEAERNKGMPVGIWLRKRRLEEGIARQLNVSVDEDRNGLSNEGEG